MDFATSQIKAYAIECKDPWITLGYTSHFKEGGHLRKAVIEM
jgi:hypothetical protein